MPTHITGMMSVKNGQKQQMLNISNAREIPYSQYSTMSEEQKNGVIICPDYPVGESGTLISSDKVSYDNGSTPSLTKGVEESNSTGITSTNIQGAVTELATPTFDEASTRTNINSGDTFKTILSKIKKFFTDLKTVAFSGSYNDLTDKPTIPTNNNQLTNGAGYITSSGSCNYATSAGSATDSTKVAKTGDTMTGALNMQGVDLNIGTSGSGSDDCGDIVFYYGNSQEKSRIWTDNEYSSSVGPNYRIYKKDGTQLYTGRLATVGELPNTVAHLGRGGDVSYPMTFNWVDGGQQPSWLWGGQDAVNMYVYNPANFSVNRANMIGDKNSSDKNADNGNGWYSIGVANTIPSGYSNAPMCINYYWGVDVRTGTAFKCNGYSVITDETIGSKSVNYANSANVANSAGVANSVAWANVSGKPNLFIANPGVDYHPGQGGYWGAMTTQSGIDGNWRHILSMDWDGNPVNWVSQLCLPTQGMQGVYYRSGNGSNIANFGWTKLLDQNGGSVEGDLVMGISSSNYSRAICFGDGTIFIQKDASSWLNIRSVNGIVYRSNWHDFKNPDGNAWANISALSFTTQSSRRYKENIIPISEDKASKILDIDVVNFDYKIDSGHGEGDERLDHTGVIAEDVVDIIPEVVSYRDIDGEQKVDSVDYSKFTPYLIKMVQMQQNKIDSMQKEINELKEIINEIRNH